MTRRVVSTNVEFDYNNLPESIYREFLQRNRRRLMIYDFGD